MKRIVLYSIASAIIIASGVFLLSPVSAEDTETEVPRFVQLLSSKIGVDEQTLSTALDEVRDEERTYRIEKREELIQNAIEDGKITDRQAEILQAMHQIREENRVNEGVGFKNRGPNREQMQEIHQNMVTMLKEKGIDVTEDELMELRSVMGGLELGKGNGRWTGKGRGVCNR